MKCEEIVFERTFLSCCNGTINFQKVCEVSRKIKSTFGITEIECRSILNVKGESPEDASDVEGNRFE